MSNAALWVSIPDNRENPVGKRSFKWLSRRPDLEGG